MTAPSTPVPSQAPVHTHPCARCGAPVGLEIGLCERCNPLGLRDSASSQVHGTVFVAVGLAVAGLAIAAHLAVSGIGPFVASVSNLRVDDGTLMVSIQVTNEGTSAGTTTCRVTDPAARSGQQAFVMSPRIAPQETITFDDELAAFGTEIRPLDVECSAP
jgi:hypothetical protein